MLDPEVNQKKFEREVARVSAERPLLEKRGLFVIEVCFPNIDVLVIPENPLLLQIFQPVVQNQLTFPSMLAREQKLEALSARPFVCRLGLDDFDLLPPTVRFLNPVTRKALNEREVPRGHVVNGSKVDLVVLDSHPITKQSFLCLRGVREYHTHPQHTGDDWFLYRGSIGVLHILDVLWRSCVKQSIPLIRVAPNQIDVTWGAPKT